MENAGWVIQALIIVIFLTLAICRPKGAWETRRKLKSDPEASEKISIEVANAQDNEFGLITSSLKSIDLGDANQTFSYQKEKISKAIDYGIKRHDWYEDQRSRMFQAVIAISSAILAVVGLSIKSEILPKQLLPMGLIGLIVIATVSIVIAVSLYNTELDSDRPYRLVSDIRFWFFRYNLPEHSDRTDAQLTILSQAKAVLAERDKYMRRVSENLNLTSSLREDLEQIFILHILQRYKSESLANLRWLLSYLVIFFAIEIAFLILISWMY